jgi:hypothetical protein
VKPRSSPSSAGGSWPARARRGSCSPRHFPSIFDSQDQAAGAIKHKVFSDPSFRTKYDGWYLYPLRLDAGNCFKVVK